MTKRRLTLALLLTGLLAACGSSTTSVVNTTAVNTTAVTATTSTTIDDLVSASGLDAKSALSTLCRAWEPGHPDHATVNSYVWDLLRPLDLVNGPNPPAYTEDDINTVVQQACAAHGADPVAFIDAVRTGLGLSNIELLSRVTAACTRYREEQRRIAQGDWSGDDVDQWMLDLALGGGVTEQQLRSAIENICR